jgi:hypothetical protein
MRTVAKRGLEIVAITDHNTVAGIAAIRREIELLTQLEGLNRLTDEERARLAEWRELANQVLVLPGFEFTATFGFHILGVFPPDTSIRRLEHVLLSLHVPAEKLDAGSTETGSATDVLTAYRVIREAGGLVIAAHANSTHGVAMRNFPFGGQTKIAYTQDTNLDALEVTDLERGARSTARFFNGSKVEYARRMHCFHGSDAHRLTLDPKNPKRLGIGDRASEFLLDDASYEALVAVLRSKQFDRTRPFYPKDQPFDTLAAAREEGPSLVQSFHESASQRGGKLTAIVNDICAFANTQGGAVFIGASPRKTKPQGLLKPLEVQQEILTALDERLRPTLDLKCDVLESEGVKVLRIQVPKGPDRPYCLDDFKYYVRDESETTLAVRDELIALIRETLEPSPRPSRTVQPPRNGDRSGRDRSAPSGRPDRYRGSREERQPAPAVPAPGPVPQDEAAYSAAAETVAPLAPIPTAGDEDAFYLPQVGVEIVSTEARNSNLYHSIRDLRNDHVIHNVTRKGARKLWSYAIQQHEDRPVNSNEVTWKGDIGLVRAEKRAGALRYDLALRENSALRIFYGVTEDGMEGRWSAFVQEE